MEGLNEISLCLLVRLRELGTKVIVVTGRPARQRGWVTRVLSDSGVKPTAVICRDEESPEVEWKKKVVERLVDEVAARGDLLCEYHDDNPDVLDAVAFVERDACLIDHSSGRPRVVRRTGRCVSLEALEECVRATFASF